MGRAVLGEMVLESSWTAVVIYLLFLGAEINFRVAFRASFMEPARMCPGMVILRSCPHVPVSAQGSLMVLMVAARLGFATMRFFHGLSVHPAPLGSQSSSVTLAGSSGLDSS